MALGARQSDIFKMVLSRGAILAVRGLVPGLVLAYFAARWLESLLAGVKRGDLLTFSSATVLCITATLLRTVVPALRAIRLDPTTVMRAE
jgi:ABC-type lipoprotein release transport system permease subunit